MIVISSSIRIGVRQTVELERCGQVAVIWMGDGENRIDESAIGDLNRFLDELEQVSGPLALVTAGVGKFFCNGFDLDWMRKPGVVELEFLPLLARILAFPAGTIAVVNGHACGAGALLSCAHDVRLMRSDRGWWWLPESDLGLRVRPAMFDLLATRLSPEVVQEALILGRRYDGPTAVAAGIVSAAHPSAELFDTAMAIARDLAHKSREAVAWHKMLCNERAIAACLGPRALPSSSTPDLGSGGPTPQEDAETPSGRVAL